MRERKLYGYSTGPRRRIFHPESRETALETKYLGLNNQITNVFT